MRLVGLIVGYLLIGVDLVFGMASKCPKLSGSYACIEPSTSVKISHKECSTGDVYTIETRALWKQRQDGESARNTRSDSDLRNTDGFVADGISRSYRALGSSDRIPIRVLCQEGILIFQTETLVGSSKIPPLHDPNAFQDSIKKREYQVFPGIYDLQTGKYTLSSQNRNLVFREGYRDQLGFHITDEIICLNSE